MLGISGPTLRFWECEFNGILTPFRTEGGQRRYTVAHIDILQKIINLKKTGMKLADIKTEMLGGGHFLPAEGLDTNIEILTERITIAVRREIEEFFHKGIFQGTDHEPQAH